ncbi:MAG: succinylglutamate desuccinylase/aspartoacylase family protein [Gemmataceae bacterium]|nr:succinylglutamate desuccinylase/aspartoacylase family protein [Gemmataceae bacterium]MDW8267192.1 succinylglutamate desuccinylase/aspartoacylase family protein [Gemmataceae bacterium]
MADLHPAWGEVPAATKTTFTFPVAVRADGSSIGLPVLVARGAHPGPTLLVTAGLHGDEFEGPAALPRVFETLDPAELHGTFVAVPVGNPPAFEAGTRTNPNDHQDIGRVFPGDPAGTVTEQLAFTLTHRFIRHASFFCDLHSAGLYYQMPPLIGYHLRPEPLLSAQRAAARAFGFPLIWGTPPLPGRSLTMAGDFGVPAIYAEITGEGRCLKDDVFDYVTGVQNLMGHLGLTQDRPTPVEPTWHVEDNAPQAGILQAQLRAPVSGIFEPSVQVLSRVMRGEEIGRICDAFGTTRHTVRAPHNGLVVFLRTFPRVLAGEPLCCVMELKE